MLRGLGNKIRLTLKQWFTTALEDAREWLEERIANAFIFFIELFEKHQARMTEELVNKMIKSGALPPEIESMLRDFREGKYEAGSVIGAALQNTAISGSVSGFLAPIFRDLEYVVNSTKPNRYWDLSIYLELYRRGKISFQEFTTILKHHGYNENQRDILLEASKQLISPDNLVELYIRGRISENELYTLMSYHGYTTDQVDRLLHLKKSLVDVNNTRDLYLRGLISEEEHDERLKKLGVLESEIPLIKKLYEVYPSVNDLITMAVREVFSPETAEKFGQYEDFPQAFAEWGRKLGLSDFWAKAYWAAHWDLPSPSQGFEMFHRGIITEDELKMLLKALDIMPFWREKLIQLSYNPLTRVDVRRMYQLGLMTAEEVYRAYLDIGYSPENAEKLTLFAIAGAAEEERDLTRTDILNAYEDGVLSRNEVKENLMKMGYDENEAEIILLKQDYDMADKMKKAEIDVIKTYYTKGVYTENQARLELTKLGLKDREINSYILKWTPEVRAKVATPSKTDLTNMLKAGVINEDTFVTEMRNLGYADKYISWYLTMAKKGVAV